MIRMPDSVRYLGFTPQFQKLLSEQVAWQHRVATGKRIERISEDTAGAARAQAHREILDTLAQNIRNAGNSVSWNEVTATNLNSGITLIQRVRELAVQAADDTLNQKARDAIAIEVDQLLKAVVDLGSKTYGGQSLFSGSKTDQDAFVANYTAGKITSVTYQGDDYIRQIEISPGRTAPLNTIGQRGAASTAEYAAFVDVPAGVNIFQAIIDLRGNIESGNLGAVSNTSLAQIDSSINHLAIGVARIGGVQTRMNSAIALNEDLDENTSKELSKIEETDLAEAAMQLTALETAYQASLNMGARIIRMSLLDFI